MPATKVKAFLDRNQIKYVTVKHSAAYTAQEVAASSHISGKELAKTVMVKINGRLCMAVLPAPRKVIIQDLREITGEDRVEFATEPEFNDAFPDCEIGAMPPFGNLYGLETYAEASLAGKPTIAFNAGTHTELIQMDYRDFERLVQPRIVSFTS